MGKQQQWQRQPQKQKRVRKRKKVDEKLPFVDRIYRGMLRNYYINFVEHRKFLIGFFIAIFILMIFSVANIIFTNVNQPARFAHPYANIDLIKTYDNVELVTIPFERSYHRKNFRNLFRTYTENVDFYVEHLSGKAKILKKWSEQSKNHIRFDYAINQHWSHEFWADDCTYYYVNMRMYLTEEKDLKAHPEGYMDFNYVEVYKSEYDKVEVGSIVMDYRDCYFRANNGERVAEIDRFEVLK